MDKIETSIHVDFKPCKLYIDDYERIIEIISEASKDIRIIVNEKYKLKEIQEITKIKGEINSIKIDTLKPYISLRITELYASIHVEKDNAFFRGIYEKINDIFEERKKKGEFLRKYPILTGFPIGICIPLTVFFLKASLNNYLYLIPLSITILILLIFSILILSMKNNSKNDLYKTDYIKKESFLERNKDELIRGIIISLFSLIAGAFITFIVSILAGVINI